MVLGGPPGWDSPFESRTLFRVPPVCLLPTFRYRVGSFFCFFGFFGAALPCFQCFGVFLMVFSVAFGGFGWLFGAGFRAFVHDFGATRPFLLPLFGSAPTPFDPVDIAGGKRGRIGSGGRRESGSFASSWKKLVCQLRRVCGFCPRGGVAAPMPCGDYWHPKYKEVWNGNVNTSGGE